ncbi:bifunctional sugar phosphate isomerase/epimerase/4-hydroxyphenylpyruvate dioxygenase family protein [Actinomadura sp. WMMB 499]|uniref:bifunctional sugar phosphate isomerase/epimerase/4-hydroxyphenylpyruvate dioxygenase family protein n=1 Tax=Actinomadura sp. WMMB 499 TaxID=1219491 RepID=UPI001243B872|nr:sugar phosphate isomerase/epimerase and 4-hydroxyphenylpyruvate domain-containing protein [Actinomadura sp. WMMB 499]QFG20836.1 sugar phosphate isomerase/epimerase and 4-hydroxyphenylpyruvate domain-containing protein [Actinomadura sp. WMMB 499]
MRRSIATVCLSGTLEDKLDAAAAAGFDGVEIFENDLLACPLGPEQVAERCAELGLRIELYQPFRDFEAVPEETHRRNLRRAGHKFALARRLGARTVLVCSSVAPEAVDDDALAARRLRALADLAAEHGLRVAYEALAWGRYVRTWERSADLVLRADHPALGLCLDSFHVLSRDGDITGITDVPAEKLFFLQLADAPHLRMDVLQWSRHHRLFPGQGAFDLAGFTARVLEAGYTGPLSLEVFNDVFRQAPPDRAAVDAMRSLIVLEETLARRAPATVRGRTVPPSPSPSPSRFADPPPPAPSPEGFAFVELAVGAESATEAARTLAAIGFAHVGQHRSKPVQLWQQGDARVLLNATGTSGTSGAAIGAFAVETGDPGRAARRAGALLAPVLPRTRGAAEADLTSVEAPDGTAVFFCRTGAADGWLGDFIRSGAPAADRTGIAAIDHLALSQPFDAFDEATLFYRSLLGLAPEHDAELAAPFGLVRSRAVTDPDRRVRLLLDGTLLRRGSWAPAVPDPQHVAFRTDDIFRTARILRESGAPILKVPANYHDDLDARLAPDPDLLAALREHDVFYDRDGDAEYFHLCTEILGSRVFFEIVQRSPGYTGYGSASAPVRMAAHRAAHGAARTPVSRASP